jgi:hypothetical protein
MPSPLASFRTWPFVLQIVSWSIFFLVVLGDVCGRLYLCLKAALQKSRSEQTASSQSKRTQINFTTSAKVPPHHPTNDKLAPRHSSRFHPYSRLR